VDIRVVVTRPVVIIKRLSYTRRLHVMSRNDFSKRHSFARVTTAIEFNNNSARGVDEDAIKYLSDSSSTSDDTVRRPFSPLFAYYTKLVDESACFNLPRRQGGDGRELKVHADSATASLTVRVAPDWFPVFRFIIVFTSRPIKYVMFCVNDKRKCRIRMLLSSTWNVYIYVLF